MPKYQNRSGEAISIGGIRLSPGETKVLTEQYLNLAGQSQVIKLSDEPPLRNGFFMILTGIGSQPSQMTTPIAIQHSLVIQIKDNSTTGTAPSDDSLLVVTAFASITDLVTDYIPLKSFTFTRKTYTDFNNQPVSLWECDQIPRLNPQLIDITYEMIVFAITKTTVFSGSADLFIKAY